MAKTWWAGPKYQAGHLRPSFVARSVLTPGAAVDENLSGFHNLGQCFSAKLRMGGEAAKGAYRR